VHRHIGPRYFVVDRRGTEAANVIHVINFDIAKRCRDPKTKQHIPDRDGKLPIGNATYMSIDSLLDREHSRKDDLEALGYVLVYFRIGQLPWQG
jgi:casein kinase 1